MTPTERLSAALDLVVSRGLLDLDEIAAVSCGLGMLCTAPLDLMPPGALTDMARQNQLVARRLLPHVEKLAGEVLQRPSEFFDIKREGSDE